MPSWMTIPPPEPTPDPLFAKPIAFTLTPARLTLTGPGLIGVLLLFDADRPGEEERSGRQGALRGHQRVKTGAGIRD